MGRQITKDTLRYGDIEAAYSEPNYLGAGIGILGQTVHKLVNDDKAEEKEKTPTITDPTATPEDDRITSSASQQMVYQSIFGQLAGNQSRNRGANALGQIGGAGSSGGLKITDDAINNQLGGFFPEKEITPESLMALIKGNPGLLTGFPRLKSPLERVSTDRLTTGQKRAASRMGPQSYTVGDNIRLDEEQEMQALSFLGEEGAAFAEGFNVGVKNRNYARRVWDQQQKDMSDAFGELEVTPSGSTSYDASVEQVAEEKVNEMAELMSQRSKMKPVEFTKRYNELKNWTNEMNSASIAVKELVTKYVEDKDSISGGTKPEILDAIDTLSRGGNGLTIKNINGITTLTGKTLNDKNVSIPISELSTTNQLRYLKKVDVESFYSNILNGDGATNKGILSNKTWQKRGRTVEQQLAAYDGALGATVKYQVDSFLDNPGTIRAIAAERLGIPYYDFEEKYGDNMELAKQDVSNHLQDQIKQRYAIKAGLVSDVKANPGNLTLTERNAEKLRKENEKFVDSLLESKAIGGEIVSGAFRKETIYPGDPNWDKRDSTTTAPVKMEYPNLVSGIKGLPNVKSAKIVEIKDGGKVIGYELHIQEKMKTQKTMDGTGMKITSTGSTDPTVIALGKKTTRDSIANYISKTGYQGYASDDSVVAPHNRN